MLKEFLVIFFIFIISVLTMYVNQNTYYSDKLLVFLRTFRNLTIYKKIMRFFYDD